MENLTIRSFLIFVQGLSMKDIQSIEALILDMDGVLWRDTHPIGDLPALFHKIEMRGWKTAFATNNATRSVDQYVQKLATFGVKVSRGQIINSGLAAGINLKDRFPSGGPVYILGEQGLFATLEEFGFYYSTDRSGIPFLGTNPDPSLPTPGGYIPGTGAILAALSSATGRDPEIIGKPSPVMYEIALTNLEVQPANALAVGDQMPTDIAAGIKAGCQTALVLTGVSSRATLRNFDFKPTFIADSLTQLIDDLE
jgi:4-nitrophenyl phosphatase